VPSLGRAEELTPDGCEVPASTPPAPAARQGGEQPSGILRRAEEVGRLAQTAEFVCREQGHILMPATLNDRGLAGILNLVPEFSEILVRRPDRNEHSVGR